MDDKGYFIIDGSHLFSSIHEIRRTKTAYAAQKLKISSLTEALMRTWSLYIGSTIRVIYYFKQNDARLRTMLEIPNVAKPGEKDHWQIKECGESIATVPDEELQRLSPQYRDHFARSEKGLDGKLICDVLLLVAKGSASNIVFLVNDRDYIPLFEAVQGLGGNVYLTGLDSSQGIQQRLAQLADKFLTLDTELESIFGILPQPTPATAATLQQEPAQPIVTPNGAEQLPTIQLDEDITPA